MNFKIVSFPQYIGSLVIASLLAIVVYILIHLQGVPHSLIILGVGLLIGHFFGIFTTAKAKKGSNKQPSSVINNGQVQTLYVGNIPYNVKGNALRELFSQYGAVNSVRIMTDRETHRSRGYGFVEMEGHAARKALHKLDGAEFYGRSLRVSEANQR
jgi:hypothetical protein